MTRSGRAGLPDLVWIVRPRSKDEPEGNSHAELRYSLRSFAKNAGGLYRRVWVVGTVPAWLSGEVYTVALEPEAEKFANIRQSLAAICADRRVARQIVVMHDDFFAIDPVEGWRGYHMGSTSSYLADLAKAGRRPETNTWVRSMRDTAQWMRERGHGDINCYECHTPLMFDRRALGALIESYPGRWMLTSCLYPEAGAGGEGELAINCKIAATDAATVEQKAAASIPYLSCNEKSFDGGVIGGYIRGMFREPCQYES